MLRLVAGWGAWAKQPMTAVSDLELHGALRTEYRKLECFHLIWAALGHHAKGGGPGSANYAATGGEPAR